MLGVDSEKDTPLAAIHDLLGDLETHDLDVEVARGVDVLDEQVDGSVLDDLERTRQKNTVYVVGSGQLHRSVARADWHTCRRQRLLDLVEFGLDRDLDFLTHGATIFSWLRLAVPADLLDAVVQLVGVTIRIVEVGCPVRAGAIAASALQLDPTFEQVVDRVDRLAQALGLPGDLVDGDVRAGILTFAGCWSRLSRLLLEQGERVVIGAETHEPPTPHELVRHSEAEQVRVEMVGLVEVRHVEAKVP